MSIVDHIRKLKPRVETYIPPVQKIQALFEAKGLDIGTLNKNLDGKPRLYVLIDILNNKTKIETTVGKTSLSWISNEDKLSLEGGDMKSAFMLGSRY